MKKLLASLNVQTCLLLSTFAFTLVALVSYIINISTEYFQAYAPSGAYFAFLILSLVFAAGFIVLKILKENKIFKIAENVILAVLPGLLMAAVMFLFLDRIYYVLVIFTYEKNETNMAALMPALVSFVAAALASLIALASSFMKDKEIGQVKE